MTNQFREPTKVLVRTFGGYPKIRNLWFFGSIATVVAEDEAYERLLAGADPLVAGAVGVPSEDVFVLDSTMAIQIDESKPFGGWDALRHYGAS